MKKVACLSLRDLQKIQFIFISFITILLLLYSLTYAQNETPAVAKDNWPQFRGVQASGIAEGKDAPVHWNVEQGANLKWKTKIPGLGHSSPVVWDEKIFITTAVGEGQEEAYLRVGLYGESPDNPEKFNHHFKVYCIDKNNGKIIWEKTSHIGIPQVMRHIKSSHATITPATDGKRVVAFFGSEGLYTYDMNGNLLWKKDLGYLDAGAFDVPEIQWGFGSSPIIYKDKVIVLCDVNNQSFITALNADTGEEIWRTNREEVPTWGTPTVVEINGKPQVIVNGWKHIGSYDVETGAEIWRMAGGGDIPVPTPVIAHNHVYITNSHGRVRPIYAIKLNAEGDISLKRGEESNEFVSWSNPRRGCYMPTPLVYGDYLYILNNNGVFTCYNAKTGEDIYRERAGGERSSYSTSPVLVDGKIYIADEYGNVYVIKAGAEYELLASNKMGDEACMATPAISGKTLFIRTTKALYAIEDKGEQVAANKSSETAKPDNPKTVKKSFTPPNKEFTDPTEIMKLVDAAAKAVETIKYDVTVEGTDALAPRVGKGTVTITATGLIDGFPGKFIIDGNYELQGFNQKFTSGSDGNIYYVTDHITKKVYTDLDFSVMGSLARPSIGAIVREFHLEEPFTDEINGEKKELLGTVDIAGEPCYEIDLTYAISQNNRAIWYISKKDFLPRRRVDFYAMQDGQQATIVKTLSNVVIEPKLDADFFQLNIPDGYEKVNQPHP